MVNKALSGTLGASVVALILMLAAFIVPQWQDKTYELAPANNGDIRSYTYKVGLTTWIYEDVLRDSNGNQRTLYRLEGALKTDGDLEQTETTPTSTTTSTVVPPQSTQIYQSAGVVAIIEDSREARDGVLGTGIPAFLIGIAFLVMLGASRMGKGQSWIKPLSVVLCVLTAVMTFIGVFLYAKVLNIGYSFIIWAGFAIFALLAGIFVIIPSSGRKAKFLPSACMVLALILGILALSTPNWYSEVIDRRPGDNNVFTGNAGVKAYSSQTETYDTAGTTLTSTRTLSSSFGSDSFTRKVVTVNPASSNEETITKCPTNVLGPNGCYEATFAEESRFKDFIPAGEKALGCGIPALLFGAVGLGFMVALSAGSSLAYAKPVTIGCAFISSALAFLGLFLYAAVTSVGASFVIYAAAGFMWVFAACMAFGLLNEGGSSSGPSTTK